MCTSRSTPASRAARAITGVPSTATRCWVRRSEPIGCTVVTTACVPSTTSAAKAGSPKSPTRSSTPSSRGAAPARRTTARTRTPRSTSAAQVRAPTNPLAPVTTTVRDCVLVMSSTMPPSGPSPGGQSDGRPADAAHLELAATPPRDRDEEQRELLELAHPRPLGGVVAAWAGPDLTRAESLLLGPVAEQKEQHVTSVGGPRDNWSAAPDHRRVSVLGSASADQSRENRDSTHDHSSRGVAARSAGRPLVPDGRHLPGRPREAARVRPRCAGLPPRPLGCLRRRRPGLSGPGRTADVHLDARHDVQPADVRGDRRRL